MQQFRRFQRNARLYLVNNALTGVTTGILLLLYNLYLVSLGYGADFIGAVLFVATIGAGLAIFPAGLCVDRFSGKTILIGSDLLIGLAGAGQILFRQPLPLLVSGFIAGVGVAFSLVINAPFLTLNSTSEERPHLFSMNISLGLVTLVLGEVLGGALPVWFRMMPWLMTPLPSWATGFLASQANPRSYQLALLFAGVIAAPGFIPLFLMDNKPPPRMTSNELQDIRRPRGSLLHVLDGLNIFVRGGRGRPQGSPLHILDGLNIFVRSPFFLLVLVWTFIGLGAGLFVPYFNIFFVQHLGASSALFGLIDGGANTITALLTLVAPWLAMRIGKVNTMVWTRLLSIPLMITIGLTSLLPLAAILYLFRQGTMDMSLGILQVYSMEKVAEQRRGIANSSYQAAFQVAEAVTTPIGGLIIAHIGYTPNFLVGAVCYLVAIAMIWWKFGRGKGRRRHTDGWQGGEQAKGELLHS